MSTVSKSYLSIVKPRTDAQKRTETTLDTIVVTPEIAKSWKLPSFQRDLKEGAKKLEVVAKEIKETEVIPGILTLGVLDKILYLVDGQHRRQAFLISGMTEAFVDVRYLHFETEAEMAAEYRKLNGRIAVMTPDDILKAMEKENQHVARIRRACPFIGYTQIRRSEKTPVVSMSAFIKCWIGSATEVPATGGSSEVMAENLSEEETDTLIGFAEIAFKAWGKDVASHRLWGNLNLCVCMWMYRRLVITPYSSVTKKIGKDLFMKCLMSLAANGEYCSWLVGRNLSERDRSPTYQRIKSMFAARIGDETGDKPRMPAPPWGGR